MKKGLYTSQDNLPKYSQAELDALVSKTVKAIEATNEKALEELTAKHEAQMEAMQGTLQSSQREALTAIQHAKDTTEQDQIILELSARLEEFESSNMAKLGSVEKELADKKVQLDAITQQYLAMKQELTDAQGEISKAQEEKAKEAADSASKLEEAKARYAELKEQYDGLKGVEREKRMAAVMKMKTDMKALAEKQFGEANKHFRALQQKQKRTAEELSASQAECKAAEAAGAKAVDSTAALKRELAEAQHNAAKLQQEAAAEAAEMKKQLNAVTTEGVMLERQLEEVTKSRDEAVRDMGVAQDSLARLAMKNTELEREAKELREVSNELMEMMEAK
ncbi:unnamed protein product [Chrysoparadoxa australica]